MDDSTVFSDFRIWMDMWDDIALREKTEDNLKYVFDSQGLVLFFKKGSDYFGATEDSRVVFAKMKHPDEDSIDGWEEEATFTALNLTKLTKNEPSQQVFSKKDLKKIKVVSSEEVLKKLTANFVDSGTDPHVLRLVRIPRDRDQADNMFQTDEE